MSGGSVTDRGFLERVFSHLPSGPSGEFLFLTWDYANRPVPEGIGVMALPSSIRPAQLIARVMDLEHYVGAIPHMTESRVVTDARYVPPEAVRVYQRVNVPLFKDIHHESVRYSIGEWNGFHCVYWNLLEAETSALSGADAARSEHHSGVWLAREGMVVYGLSSVPRRDDLGFLKWKAFTAGASRTAPRLVQENIKAMMAWAARVGG